MSPQSNYGLLATIVGGVMSALGYSDWQRRRINRLEEKVNAGCPTLEKVDKRLTRIEQKVPSGDVTCASNEEVTLIFEKLDELTVKLTKTFTILEERLPKR